MAIHMQPRAKHAPKELAVAQETNHRHTKHRQRRGAVSDLADHRLAGVFDPQTM
jgi:hypothetical protein